MICGNREARAGGRRASRMEERGQERHKEIDNKGKELIPLPDILENMNIDEKRRCRGNEEIFEGDDENGDGDIDDDERGGVDDDPEILYRDPPEGYLRLRPSQFQLIPGTIFVEYPPELGENSSKEYADISRIDSTRHQSIGKIRSKKTSLHVLLGKKLCEECVQVLILDF